MSDLGKIRWQCRRGMLELDIIFEKFLNQHFQELNEEEKQAFVKLLEQPDPVLYAWLMQYEVPEDPQDKLIVQKIQSFRE